MIYIQTILFFLAIYVTLGDIIIAVDTLKHNKYKTKVSWTFLLGISFIWTLFFISMNYTSEPSVIYQEADYIINIDNDSLYITSPGIEEGQTKHYQIPWGDSISVQDIILLDNL
jgi:hypothetical protein